jgi:ribosomal protein S12 methylthiotransferase
MSLQAPEVDGVIYINDGPVKAGTIQMVRITESHDYDLVGEVVGGLD